ncbi:MAG TPA: hypothetical protein VMW43_10895 [Bacteroidota bacterium]|nr:hypothetical protein [Bacteroidota bacterium]
MSLQHIDEHTLELFVLNAPEVEDLRNSIRDHLAVCAGCRDLAESMTEFHADLAVEVARREVRPGENQTLVRRVTALTGASGVTGMPERFRPVTPAQKIRFFVRRHPIATITGSFGTAAAFALLAFLVLRPPASSGAGTDDTQIAYAKLNSASGTLDVYNREHRTLWQKPVLDVDAAVASEAVHNIRQYAIADLNRDGSGELITNLTFSRNPDDDKRNLNFYTPQGTMYRSIPAEGHPSYRGRSYHEPYGFYGVVPDTGVNGALSIYSIGQNGRSPSFLARFDSAGNCIGEYWHYGVIVGATLVNLFHTGHRLLVLSGINDVDDDKHMSRPVFIVLDPAKVTGKTESSATRGFGLPASDAELYYVGLPLTDMDIAVRKNPSVSEVRENDGILSVFATSLVEHERLNIEYDFNPSMAPVDICPTTGMLLKRGRLAEQGLLHGNMDSVYLAGLKHRIQYWNGSAWTTQIRQVHP